MMRSRARRAVRSKVSQDLMSRLQRRVAKRRSIGATMRGITVMAKDVTRQRVCSEWVGYSKDQPMQCRPPKMTPKRAKTAIRDQRSLFVTGAYKDGTWEAPGRMVLVVTIPKTAVKMKETSKRRVTNGMTKMTKRKRRKKKTGRRMYQPKRKRRSSLSSRKISSNQRPTNFPTAELSL